MDNSINEEILNKLLIEDDEDNEESQYSVLEYEDMYDDYSDNTSNKNMNFSNNDDEYKKSKSRF